MTAPAAASDFWESLHQDLMSGEFLGAVLAFVLVIALRLLLPERARKLVRQPMMFFLGHLVAQTFLHVIPQSQEGVGHRVLLVFALLLLLASIGRSSVLLVLDVGLGRRLERPLPKIIGDLTQGVVYLIVGLSALRAAGIDPGSLLTTSALLTAVIGLSLQETLGNMFAGLAIQMQRPFDVGDWIQFDADPKHIGRVLEINWRATTVITLDEVEVIVPNGALGKVPITNFTKPEPDSRRSIYYVLPYSLAPKRAQRLVLDAIGGSFGVLADPKPSVVTNQFTESGVEYWLRFWTDRFGQRDAVDGGVRDRIWYALSREGIPFAFPNRGVFIHDVSDDSRAREASARANKRIAALMNVDFLALLPKPELERLATVAQSRLYATGEAVVHKGDKSSDLFIINSGSVKIMVPKKKELEEIARLEQGKFFGEMALMTGEPRNAHVVAAEECELIAIDREAFKATLDAHPELAETISRVLAERQAKLTELEQGKEEAAQIEERTSQILGRIKSFFSI